jgi:hypothetical protein
MNHKVLRLITLLILIAAITSSCGEGRWRRMHYRENYVHKHRYRAWHNHRHRDW